MVHSARGQQQNTTKATAVDWLPWQVAVVVAGVHMLLFWVMWSKPPHSPRQPPPDMLMIDLNTVAQLDINNTPSPVEQVTAKTSQADTPPSKQQQTTMVPKLEPKPQPKPAANPKPKVTTIKPKPKPAAQVKAVEPSSSSPSTLKQPEATTSVQHLTNSMDKPTHLSPTVSVAAVSKASTVSGNAVSDNANSDSAGTVPPASLKNNSDDAVLPATHIGGHLANPQPPYPYVSRDNGEEGSVGLRVQVSKDGRAEAVEVVKSSGFARLDRCAQKAVEKYRFSPATQGGVPIPFSYTFSIHFSLSDP